jgi:DNA (cytosine-5)-methyltransferase 1
MASNGHEKTNIVKFIDLFAGMGGLRIGFQNAVRKKGMKSECVFTSEIKPHACEIYEYNFSRNLSSDNHTITGDITKVDETEIPEFDYLLAGFPCQAFSSAGKKLGFNEARGTLFFDIARILEHSKPTGFILENVDFLEKHDGGNTYNVIVEILENIGYIVTTKVLDSLHFGIPQQRKRIFIVGNLNEKISLDDHQKKVSTFSDIVEQGLETYDSEFTKRVLSLYSPEELHGKKFKDKRGGPDNIHSWDLELRGPCDVDQKIIMRRLLKQRRRKSWADIIGIKWMDGMPLTAKQIHTFCEDYNLQKLTQLLDDLVVKKYLSFEHPKQSIDGKRVPDQKLDKGYNIVTGKLSFELNKIMDPEGYSPTIVATEGDKYGVIDNGKIRRLSERECLRFFGFPEEYQSNIHIKDLYDLVGNTVVIPVVEFVGERLLQTHSTDTR